MAEGLQSPYGAGDVPATVTCMLQLPDSSAVEQHIAIDVGAGVGATSILFVHVGLACSTAGFFSWTGQTLSSSWGGFCVGGGLLAGGHQFWGPGILQQQCCRQQCPYAAGIAGASSICVSLAMASSSCDLQGGAVPCSRGEVVPVQQHVPQC